MPLTTAGKNAALDGLKAVAVFEGLFSKGADITGVTGVTSSDTFTKASHGLTNGDLVTVSGLTGGSALVAGDPYYVIGVSGSNFQLSLTSGGSAVDLGSDVSAATVNKWTELSGGSPAYARKSIAWGTTTASVMDDSTNGNAFDVPSAATVDAQSLHSASTAGTLYSLMPVTREGPYGSQGIYNSTDVKITGSS